jgi:prolyl 4-hydroxylase
MKFKHKYYLIFLFFLLLLTILFSLHFINTTTKRTEGFQYSKIVPHTFENNYVITEIYGFLSYDECDEIINLARKKGFEESTVADTETASGSSINKSVRTSKTCWIDDFENAIANKITESSIEMTKIPRENHEELQVAKYDIGGKFDRHHDYCDIDGNDNYCDKFNRNSGNRRSTLLVYLNDNFNGGETEFVQLGLKIKPEKGKAILFWNVDEKGGLYTQSEHCGNPVLNGEKIIATKWSHMYKFVK